MLNYALIGFGGLGKVHFGGTKKVSEIHKDIKLVAICDVDESRFSTNVATNLGEDNSSLDLSSYNLYTSTKELFANEKLDFIISAVPTHIHDEIAIEAMEKGIHVFSEKPMAIDYERAKKMLDVAKKNNVKLMIGQCLRFAPAYVILKDIIDSKEYGNVVKAEFARISQTPVWGWENWYMDSEKSGGATLDLHVHDLDYINYVFGKPKSVMSFATNKVVKQDSITTYYDYEDKIVIATGEWGHPSSYQFNQSFRVRFERATLEFTGKKLTLYTSEESREIETPGDCYVDEVVEFVNCIKENRESKINPPTASFDTIEIAMAEKKSADTHQVVEI